MNYKIIEEGAKFRIKQVDENGNSLGLVEGVFDTHEDASAFIMKLESGEEVPPEALAAGSENHSSGTTPGPDDKDHFIEVSALAYGKATPDSTEDDETSFMLTNYYLNADGTKTVKGSEKQSFPGILNPLEVVDKVKTDLVEPGWAESVVWSDETTPTPAA